MASLPGVFLLSFDGRSDFSFARDFRSDSRSDRSETVEAERAEVPPTRPIRERKCAVRKRVSCGYTLSKRKTEMCILFEPVVLSFFPLVPAERMDEQME